MKSNFIYKTTNLKKSFHGFEAILIVVHTSKASNIVPKTSTKELLYNILKILSKTKKITFHSLSGFDNLKNTLYPES